MEGEFEAVIGLEVHAQLATDTKIFCSCRAKPPEGVSVGDEPPNIHTCPICAGHPGSLPVLNRKALEFAILAGLATHCKVQSKSVFARKNYFYPDLPKGYQISQSDQPICKEGHLEIEISNGEKKKIRIQRIHMEEDAGKSVHQSGYSLVNLNRAGVPLIEIVSEPDISNAIEASTYLKSLHSIVTYLGVCDGNMQEGNFRCDANVSVRRKGGKKLGTRTEIKNLNSFRFIEKAIDYEIARQIGVIQSGGKISQETRLYDSARNVTLTLRSKEDAHDYHYFPDPDLPPIFVPMTWIDQLRASLPELADQRKNRFVEDYGLSPYDASALTASKATAEFFEQTLQILKEKRVFSKEAAKEVANFLTGEVSRLLNEGGIEMSQSKLVPEHLAELASQTLKQAISSTGAKQVLSLIWKTGDSVSTVINREGLSQVSDETSLKPIVEQVLKQFPGQVAEFKAGKEKVMGFFVGQAMKVSGGKANPELLRKLFLAQMKS